MTLEDRHKTLIEYLKVKLEEKDWHVVSDAANDLRELEVEMRLASKIYITSNNKIVDGIESRYP